MIEYCRAHPEIKTISLVPNDGFGWCECERCSTFYDKSHRGEFFCVSEHVYQAQELYHDMVADIAAMVNRERPDVTITLCAYINYVDPAKDFRLNPGMATHFAPYWRCINHSIGDEKCPVNRRYMKSFHRWQAAKCGGKLNVYEYYMGVNMYLSLPMVHHEEVFRELCDLKTAGADGILTQFHLSHWTAYGLNFYMMAKAAWAEDARTAVDRCMDNLFGPDAAEAKAFFDSLRTLQLSAGPCLIPYPRSLFSRTDVLKYEALLSRAQSLRDKSPHDSLRNNIAIWMEYLLRFKRLFDQYKQGQDVQEEITQFHEWVRAHPGAGVFVMRNVDRFLPRWLEQIAKRIPWYHFNIEWEDKYIQQHDDLLNRTDW